jgi:hypothetical protein
MKVTRDMAEKLYFAMHPDEEDVTDAELKNVEGFLEAVLKGVPEPGAPAVLARKAATKSLARAEAAEAKLAKVRALAEAQQHVFGKDILTVLDGEDV